MLSLLAPGYLLAAVAAAAALVAAHFIVRRQPRTLLLPTARFVPDIPVVTAGWARAPADPLILALRALAVILAGVALAGPVIHSRPGGIARVILVDRSRAVADAKEVEDSVASLIRPGDAVVGYAAASLGGLGGSSEHARGARNQRGSLSAGLVAAVRAASAVRERADSLELVIVSTFAAEQLDAATADIRREWPGRARLVRISAAVPREASRTPELVADREDAFSVAFSAAMPTSPAEVRVARRELGAADSAWLAAAPGRVLVHWPIAAAPTGFIARAPSSTHAVVTANAAIVAPFQRRWRYVRASGSTPVAWWMDGDVAAAEAGRGNGCVRSVAVPVSARGDFVLRPDFHAVLRELMQPCGGATVYAMSAAPSLGMLRGPAALAPSTAFARPDRDVSAVTRWLLLAALACALLELFFRRTASPRQASAPLRAQRGPTARRAA